MVSWVFGCASGPTTLCSSFLLLLCVSLVLACLFVGVCVGSALLLCCLRPWAPSSALLWLLGPPVLALLLLLLLCVFLCLACLFVGACVGILPCFACLRLASSSASIGWLVCLVCLLCWLRLLGLLGPPALSLFFLDSARLAALVAVVVSVE